MTDDQLIRKFMQENARTPEDNGFCERVMSRLPRRPINTTAITLLEMVVLAVGCLLLLSQVDLTQVLCNLTMYTLQFATYLRYTDISTYPLYIITAIVLLTIWGKNRIKELT